MSDDYESKAQQLEARVERMRLQQKRDLGGLLVAIAFGAIVWAVLA